MKFNPTVEISVLIPVYNVERYIVKCMNSLLNQTFTNWEAVIYDDGSTDNTVEKILQYNDPRIKLIKSDINQGIGIARQQAFKYSSGNWIYILDGDDWIEHNTFEVMLSYARENDMVIAGIENSYCLNKICDNQISCLLSYCEYPCLGNHLIKRDVFIHSDLRKTEDLPSLLKMFSITRKIQYIDTITYHYRQHCNSIIGKLDKQERLIYTGLGLIEAFEFNKQCEFLFKNWFKSIQKELENTEIENLNALIILNYNI